MIKPISFNSKKRNQLLYTTCVHLKSITLRGKKKSDTKASYCMINLYEGLEKANLQGQRDQMEAGNKKRGLTTKRAERNFIR